MTLVLLRLQRVVMEMGAEAAALQMVSFHSLSKGFTGECGIRGGYFELHNIPDGVKAMLYKLASISLCSNLMGLHPRARCSPRSLARPMVGRPAFVRAFCRLPVHHRVRGCG